MELCYQLVRLTPKFYQDYPSSAYPEIMKKPNRVYSCLLLQVKDYYICIPYRSNIGHPYAFLFKGTKRSQKGRSGLDLSKMVIVKNDEYIDATPSALVDKDEYIQTVTNIEKIAQKAEKYLDDYIAIQTGTMIIAPEEHQRRYGVSTLPYFHKELGL